MASRLSWPHPFMAGIFPEILLDFSLVLASAGYTILAPYNKVEESFNLHATHDTFFYGVSTNALSKYDHVVFPGPVPRTFIGSVMLGWATKATMIGMQWIAPSLVPLAKIHILYLARFILGFANSYGLFRIRKAATHRFGRLTGMLFVLITLSQFHLLFWMSRTLPNMFALLPVNFAISLLLDRAPQSTAKPSLSAVRRAMGLLTFTAAIMRAEVALLLAPYALQALWSQWISFGKLFRTGLVWGIASAALTIAVDSHFWRTPVWPELSGVHFNIVQGKSADWGTLPVGAYFTSFLPKILLSAYVHGLAGILLDRRLRQLGLPALVFVALMSALGHKEWRFVIYVVPIFNVSAARTTAYLMGRPKSSIWGRLCFLVASGSILANFAASYGFAGAAINNYPGGEALRHFNSLYENSTVPIRLHISNLAAQTGASLFLQENAAPYINGHISSWEYDKTEHLSDSDLLSYTHQIAERPPLDERTWRVVETTQIYDGWTVDWDILRGSKKHLLLESPWAAVGMKKKDVLWTLEQL